MKAYQITEHTADIGLRVRGRDLKELLIHSAEGLFHLVTDLDQVKRLHKGPKTSKLTAVSLDLKAGNAADLFLRWLREWLFLFSAKRLIPVRFHFRKLTEKRLSAVADCATFDPCLHEQRYEVKAITYHAFKIERGAKGWIAEVIADV